MKMRIMLYLVLVVLFGFAGNPFAVEEAEKPMNVMDEPSEIDIPEEYDEIIGPQGTEGTYNTFYGNNAGHAIATNPDPPPNPGLSNTFIGSQAGYNNELGWANTFVGRNAGYNNTAGGNTFIGYYAGLANTSSEGNTFVGSNAGEKNTGEKNAFFGHAAGLKNTTGYQNAFFGYNAGAANTTANANAFFGSGAGARNTTGKFNCFFGNEAGYANTEGLINAFFGTYAGHKNTTGGSNAFFGYAAGQENTTGIGNSFFGHDAGHDNTTGNTNAFFGNGTGAANTTGRDNCFFGSGAGWYNQTGSGNVFLGHKAGTDETGSNRLYIDNSGTNSPLIWGDFNTNNVVIYGGFRSIASYSSSDGRWKKNIQPLESSLEKISNLQGVSYEWKTDEYPDFGLMEGKQIGLIAQAVEKELPELVSEDKDGYKAVSYTKLTAVLVEAVKELKTENHSQKKLIMEQQDRFQAEIEELRALIKELKG